MRIHCGELADVTRYIEEHKHITLEDQQSAIESVFDNIERFKPITPETRILEVGVGDGWLQIYARRRGLDIRGLEISEQLMEISKQTARRYGVELDLSLGNIEETDIGDGSYDIIIARSIFEHVEQWQKGVENIYGALRPGGLFYFDSTNKFSFTSGEYSFPLYGWMPNSWRYALRRARQGEDIMKLGIDFHQFTYPQLRRFFRRVGYKTVLDWVDLKDTANVRSSSALKKAALSTLKRARPLKHVALNFAPATIFICIK